MLAIPAPTAADRPTRDADTDPPTGPGIDRPPRDLTVDLMRAVAMVAVAVGHWLVVVPSYAEGRFDGVNALRRPRSCARSPGCSR